MRFCGVTLPLSDSGRGAPPDIIGTTHISPPQCVTSHPRLSSPIRFLVSYLHFSLFRSWSLSSLPSLSLSLSPAPKFTFHVVARAKRRRRLPFRRRATTPLLRASPFSSARGPVGASRRLYIASGKILRGNTAGLGSERIDSRDVTDTDGARPTKKARDQSRFRIFSVYSNTIKLRTRRVKFI